MPSSVIGSSRFLGVRLAQGFTLIELLVALALVATLLAVAPAQLAKVHEAWQYQSTVRQMTAGLRAARGEAITSGQAQRFVVDLRQRHYGREGGRQYRFPEGLEVQLDIAAIELDRNQRGAIRFYPDGSATGGTITLQRPSGQGVRLRVDWLLGWVDQVSL